MLMKPWAGAIQELSICRPAVTNAAQPRAGMSALAAHEVQCKPHGMCGCGLVMLPIPAVLKCWGALVVGAHKTLQRCIAHREAAWKTSTPTAR